MGKLTDKQLQEQVLLLTRGCEGVYTPQELQDRLKASAEGRRPLVVPSMTGCAKRQAGVTS